MNKLETTLINQAHHYCQEAESWSKDDGTKATVIACAKDIGIPVEQYIREQYANATMQCNTLCGLAHFDSGLSCEGADKLREIEDSLVKQKRIDDSNSSRS